MPTERLNPTGTDTNLQDAAMVRGAWSKEWPKVTDAFHWMRWCDGRYRDLPVHVAGIHVMCLLDRSHLQRGNIEGEVQFLGPITPVDTERLVRLETALQQLADNDLTDDNCASVDIAAKRVRNIARAALEVKP
jgi:hypothetical protein